MTTEPAHPPGAAAELADGYRGLLAIDVDGPLNPYAAKPSRRPEGYLSYRLTRDGRWLSGREFRKSKGLCVWLNPAHGRLILDLAEETGLRPVWATTWLDMANTHIGPAIGLPELPVIQFPDSDLTQDGPIREWGAQGGWKFPGMAAVSAGVPLAWLDDEFRAGGLAAAQISAFEGSRVGVATLLCAVDPATGLGVEHCDRVRQWATTF